MDETVYFVYDVYGVTRPRHTLYKRKLSAQWGDDCIVTDLINACLGRGHVVPQQDDATLDRFLRRVFTSRCWAAAGGPMGCLCVDEVRDATIDVASGVFWESAPSARRLYHSTNQAEFSQCCQCIVVLLGAVCELWSTVIVCACYSYGKCSYDWWK
jgi:hypothetical protein